MKLFIFKEAAITFTLEKQAFWKEEVVIDGSSYYLTYLTNFDEMNQQQPDKSNCILIVKGGAREDITLYRNVSIW